MTTSATGRKQYRSMRGKIVDMERLAKKNELTPAVGNARVNARGDQIGPGGKIVKRREELIKEYYDAPQRAVPDTDTPNVKPRVPTAKPAPTAKKKTNTRKPADNWVEDENGNFVPKEQK